MTKVKKKPSALTTAICAVCATVGLYLIAAVPAVWFYDAAPKKVQAAIKFAYEPLFAIIERIFPS